VSLGCCRAALLKASSDIVGVGKVDQINGQAPSVDSLSTEVAWLAKSGQTNVRAMAGFFRGACSAIRTRARAGTTPGELQVHDRMTGRGMRLKDLDQDCRAPFRNQNVVAHGRSTEV